MRLNVLDNYNCNFQFLDVLSLLVLDTYISFVSSKEVNTQFFGKHYKMAFQFKVACDHIHI